MTALLALGSALFKVIAGIWSWCGRHRVATPWILCGVLAALLVAQHWDGIRRAADLVRAAQTVAQARSEEEARARQAGLAVVTLRSQADVEAAVDKAKDLRARLNQAEAEVGRLTVKYVVHAETSGAPARGTPRPNEPLPVLAQGQTLPPPVLLRMDDRLKLVFDGAVVSGKAGAETLHGFGEAIRTSDGVSLTRQPIDVPVTVASKGPEAVCPDPPARRDWRVGAVGGGQAGPGGVAWLVGGQVLYRERWTVAGAGGPRTGVVLAGFVF